MRIGNVSYGAIGDNFVLLLAAAVAVWLGVMSYRHMDDRPGVPLLRDLTAVWHGHHPATEAAAAGDGAGQAKAARGLLLVLEGGEGAGKSTQARLLAIWLRDQGFDVVTTHEPGATKIGMRLRALLLDTAHTGLAPNAEALMYAADRAEHVTSVLRPALERGAIVVCDRYVDSSLAYQGAGRQLPQAEIAESSITGRPAACFLTSRSCSTCRPRPASAAGPARLTGSRRSRPSSTSGCAPGSWPWRGPSQAATWSSTRPGRPAISAAISTPTSASCCRTRYRRRPRKPPAASRRSGTENR